MEIELGAEPQESAAEADGGAFEEHELARDGRPPPSALSARITWPISLRPYSAGLTPSATVRTRSSRIGPQMKRAQMFIASIVAVREAAKSPTVA